MPLYEYLCNSCKHRFERIQKFSDPLVDTCPECSGPVQKLLSAPAFQFKGTGWYVTDYARKDQTSEKDTKEKPSGDGTGKAEPASGSSSETKGGDAKKSSSSDAASKSSSSTTEKSSGSSSTSSSSLSSSSKSS